jgi:hypothetical protein
MKKKYTTSRTCDCCPRLAEIAHRVARLNNPDDAKELFEANASLIDARDGDRRRLKNRLLDKSAVLTFEERQFLADFIAPAAKRRRGKPVRPSTLARREVAGRALFTALVGKAQWKPGYDTIEKLIAEISSSAQSGLCHTDVWEIYNTIAKATVRFRDMTDVELAAAKEATDMSATELAALKAEISTRLLSGD